MEKIVRGFFALCLFFYSAGAQQSPRNEDADTVTVHLKNVLDVSRIDEPVSIDWASIMKRNNRCTPARLIVTEGSNELPSQIDDTDRDGIPDLLTFVVSFVPREEKTIVLRNRAPGLMPKAYTKRTQAELSTKVDFEFVGGKYTKGRYVRIDSIRVPAVHTDHDALFRHEGPGWESDNVAYRFYLDARNRTDIFGKKLPALVMHTVGVNDLVADNNESYESMMEWGMDNFKVGNSLGIGSIATLRGKDVVTVSKTDSVICVIAANGPVRSDVRGLYYGWNVDGTKYFLVSDYAITAGSRLTKVNAVIAPDPGNICTGLARHDQTTVLESPRASAGDWKYLGIFGRQSRVDDAMGIALFYKSSDCLQRLQDDVNELVVLKPRNGSLTYYFAATWEQEPNGIATLDQFRLYLEDVTQRLDNPIRVSF